MSAPDSAGKERRWRPRAAPLTRLLWPLLRAAGWALERAAPALGARWLEHVFCTPRHAPVPDAARRLLTAGQR